VGTTYKDDEELFDLVRTELFTAVVGDVMDTMGFTRQFLPPTIKPVRDDMILVGRAMPVIETDYPEAGDETGHSGVTAKPFGLMLEALDELRSGEVYIASGSTQPYALWGELMSTRALQLGANGALVNGYARDIAGICALDYPTFAIGSFAQDQGPRGKVIDYRVPVEIGGVRIAPGSLVFGDREGVLVVPQSVEREIVEKALEKARGEKLVARAIRDGMSAVEAFRTFGIM
jgi:regulator of RNase E activity RraA